MMLQQCKTVGGIRGAALGALMLVVSAALCTPGTSAQSQPSSLAQKKAAAREQYSQAEKLRVALNGKPKTDRTEREYRQLITAYRRVYLTTPHAVEVPAALLAVAELYNEMGRQFDPKYHQTAIDAYLFLMKHYPTTRYRDDALFTVGKIQHEDLAELDTAQATFDEFLKRFPRSDKAAEVRAALQAIAREREAQKSAAATKQVAEERAQSRKLPRVTTLRHWNAENSTRVVIDVEDAVTYQAARISNPDRIYFDLTRAKLSPALAGKTLEVEGGFLKAIRVAQNQIGVVRVVLEVEKVKDYSVFTLPNPFRLVVDVHGEPLTLAKATEAKPAARTEKTEEKAAAEKPAEKPAKTEVARKEPAADPKPAEKKPETKTVAAASPNPPPPTANGQTLTRALGAKIGRVMIDAGHGGHDTGTIGPTGLMEKDVCLDVALRLGSLLREKMPEIDVAYTREDDSFVPLENRAGLANQAKADLFISIHANSSRDKRARGIETYYLHFASSDDALEVAARENVLSQASISELQDIIKKIANNEKAEESRELASEVQKSLSKRLQRVTGQVKNRGVKKAPFVVLIGANMPSVLTEVSFISNPSDESMLKKPEHRQRVAEGLFQGVKTYMQNLGTLTYNRSDAGLPGASNR